MQGTRLRLHKGDFLILVLILLLAAGASLPYLLSPSNILYCIVQQDKKIVRRIRLAQGYQESFTISGAHGDVEVEIDGLRVRILQAQCPDQVCVQTGWLTHTYQSAVCLPNRVIVQLTGENQREDDLDAIVGGT